MDCYWFWVINIEHDVVMMESWSRHLLNDSAFPFFVLQALFIFSVSRRIEIVRYIQLELWLPFVASIDTTRTFFICYLIPKRGGTRSLCCYCKGRLFQKNIDIHTEISLYIWSEYTYLVVSIPTPQHKHSMYLIRGIPRTLSPASRVPH